MSEKEPVASVLIGFEVKVEDITQLIEALGAVAIDRVRIGQGQLDFVEDIEKEQLKERVSLLAATSFYQNYFQDDKVSPLATVVINKIGGPLADDQKEVDEHGRVVWINRSAWDDEIRKVRAGKSESGIRPRTKSRKFADDFTAYMPSVTDS